MNYVKAIVINNLPTLLEGIALKPTSLVGKYDTKQYGWFKNEEGVFLRIDISMDLMMHNVKNGNFTVQGYFDAKTITSANIAYEAIKATIDTLNTELPKFAGVFCASKNYRSLVCPDFELLREQIAKRLFGA